MVKELKSHRRNCRITAVPLFIVRKFWLLYVWKKDFLSAGSIKREKQVILRYRIVIPANTVERKHATEMKTSDRIYIFFFYVLLFFLLSFAGWIWEAAIYLIEDGVFVNRGVLSGPWLPVYGSGGLLLAFLLKRWEYRPVRTFFMSMIICSLLEYISGYFLERVWGIRWWDYSGQFLNIDGRICLWGSLMFGVGGWLLICYIIPYLEILYRRIWKADKGRKFLQLICLALILIFTADAAWAADFPNRGENITMPL